MVKWFAIAAGLGLAALGVVLLMHNQEAGNWGDTAEHLPSGSATRLETSPPADITVSQETEPAIQDEPTGAIQPAPTTASPLPAPAPAPEKNPKASVTPPPVALTVPPAPEVPPPAQTPPKPALLPNVVNVDLAWVREPPEGELTTAAFMVLTNEGPAPDRLLSVSSPDARTVSVHATRMRDGVSENVPMQQLELEPGVPVVFEPGGVHLTLDGLRHPLASGRKITIFLIFEKAGTVQVGLPVGEPQPESGPGGSG